MNWSKILGWHVFAFTDLYGYDKITRKTAEQSVVIETLSQKGYGMKVCFPGIWAYLDPGGGLFHFLPHIIKNTLPTACNVQPDTVAQL